MGKFIKGKTPSGYKFSIDEGVIKDIRFLRALNDATGKNSRKQLDGTFKCISVIFNDEEKEEEFYQFLTEKNGGERVPIEMLGAELNAMFLALNEANENLKK